MTTSWVLNAIGLFAVTSGLVAGLPTQFLNAGSEKILQVSVVPPAGATIVAAYLYWGGSGSTVDASVTLNGSTITASRTFTTTFSTGGTNFPFFGGFANVTAAVAGNGNFTFGGLTVNTGTPHCSSSAVVAGWSLVVVYRHANEALRAVNVFDGLQFFRGSTLTLTPDGFRVPAERVKTGGQAHRCIHA